MRVPELLWFGTSVLLMVWEFSTGQWLWFGLMYAATCCNVLVSMSAADRRRRDGRRRGDPGE